MSNGSFYEWKSEAGSKTKQPYFIYFQDQEPQLSESDLEQAQAEADQLDAAEAEQEGAAGESEDTSEGASSQPKSSCGSSEHQPKRLLTMAGLFDKWTPPKVNFRFFAAEVISGLTTSSVFT